MTNTTAKLDFNSDGLTDLVWRDAGGHLAIWNMSRDGLHGTASSVIAAPADYGVFFGDANGDHTTDLVLQSAAGDIHTWTMSDDRVVSMQWMSAYAPGGYSVSGMGDANGDGRDDLFVRVPQGTAPAIVGTAEALHPELHDRLGEGLHLEGSIVGMGDFNGDGRDDYLLHGERRGAGQYVIGLENPTLVPGSAAPTLGQLAFQDPGDDWTVRAVADFNGDGKTDILWHHVSGANSIWLMDGARGIGGGMVADPGRGWNIAAVGDYDNDGKADLMWHHVSGWYGEWDMNGSEVDHLGASFAHPGGSWALV